MVERINGRTITTVYCDVCDWILGSKFIKVAAGDERPIVGECVLKRVIKSPPPSPVKDQEMSGFIIFQKSHPEYGDCYICSNCDTRIASPSHVLPDLPVNLQVVGISFSSGDVNVSTKDSGLVERINGCTITTVYCRICDWILGSKFIKVAAADERPIVGECVLKRLIQSPPPSPVEDQNISGFIIQKSQPDFGECNVSSNCDTRAALLSDVLSDLPAVAGRIYAAEDTEIGDFAVARGLTSEQSRGTCLTCNREVEWSNFPCMCPAWCRLCMYRVERQKEKFENLDLKCAFCNRSIEQFANIYVKVLSEISKQEQKKAVRSKSKKKKEERRLSKLKSCSQWDQELDKERAARN